MTAARLRELARAAVGGSVGAIVDLGVLLLLAALGLSAWLATVFAATAGSLVNFSLAKWFAFRAPGGRIVLQGGLFAAQSSVWIGLSALVVHACVAFLRSPLVVARLIADAVVFLAWGYPAQRWIFTRT